MIQYDEIEEIKKIKVQKSITCDCCRKTKSFVDSGSEWRDAYNFIKIKKEFGYGSEIGDEEKISIDICEQCFIEKFGIELIGKHII